MPNDELLKNEKELHYQNPIMLGLVALFAGVAVALIQYKIPTIMMDIMGMFSMSAELGSWLMSIFTLMGIFVAIPSGALAQHFGAKRMIVVALGIAVVGSLIGLVSGTSTMIIVSRAVEGIALTLLTTCGPILVQACVKSEKIGLVMGIWGIWGCLGSTIAAVITPTLFEQMGFEGVWIAYAAVAVVAAVVVCLYVRMPKKNEMEAEDSSEVVEVDPVEPPRYREVFSRDTFFFFIGFAIFNICLLAILSYVPTILQMQGFDPTLSGFISTAPMLLSVIASPLFGAISDKIGRYKPLLLLSTLVMGPCTFLLYTQTGTLLWVAVGVMGLIGMGAIGMFLSSYMKILPRPELASVGMGVMILVQGTGQFLGSFFVQMLLGADLTNWAFAGMVLMVLGLIGTASLCFVRIK